MKGSCLDMLQIAKLIQYTTRPMVQLTEFDETNGSQVEQENLDDVRATNSDIKIKNMPIGDVRTRDVDKDDENSIKVIPLALTINDQHMASTSNS